MRIKSEEKRQKIIEAASKIFAKYGFDNASMAEITAKVGGSKATIYNYFKSKEEIFVCATEKIAGEFKKTIRDSLQQTDAPIEQTLKTFSLKLLKFLTRKEIISAKRMILSPTTPKDVCNYFYQEGPGFTRSLLSDYLQMKIDKGVLNAPNANKVAEQLTSLLIHVYHEKLMLQVDMNFSEDELNQHVDDTVDLILTKYLVKK